MCGICGAIYFHHDPLDEGLIQQMARVLDHRGPDQAGSQLLARGEGPRVGLGHTRLKVIDPSEAASQ